MDFERLKRTRKVSIPLGDEAINLEYIPARWDNRFVETHNELLGEEGEEKGIETGRERYIHTILSLVYSWDVTHEDKPLPITRESLEQFESAVLFLIYQALRTSIEERDKEKNS